MDMLSLRGSKVAISVAAILFVVVLTMYSVPPARAQYKETNHVVTADSAMKYIQNFKKNRVAPATDGGFFGRNIFDKILAQPGVIGIRYYYAAKDDGSPTIVLVGVDSAGDDMVQGIIGELIIPCPPICASPNMLNK